MQALILAAGESSRMRPLSNGIHKSMLMLLGKPLLQHVIEKLKEKEITNIVVVIGKDSNIENYFGDGRKFGVSLTYVTQENPSGMGEAILLAEKYLDKEFILLNAYHLEVDKVIDSLLAKNAEEVDGVLLVKQTKNPSDYGIVSVEGDRVKQIVEKPESGKEPTDLRIIGIYLLSFSFFAELKKTTSEHYSLETALNTYVKNHNVVFVETKEETIVLKYPWDLLAIKDYLLKDVKSHRGENVSIADSAQIIGEVWIEDNVTILEGACIKGPCYLGKNSYIGSNALLRNRIDVEGNVVIGAYMETMNSIFMKGVTTHSGFIGDSIVGDETKIGAQFCTANVRLDRETVKALVKEKKVDSGLKHFGMVIGSNSLIGIKSSTMPGVIIGSRVSIGPSTTVLHNVEDGKKYYTKFQEIINE